ncbi:MAG: c-type cytochrome [Planctomycetales bacterium]|jgi:mono/diheme cytochrome c family protein
MNHLVAARPSHSGWATQFVCRCLILVVVLSGTCDVSAEDAPKSIGVKVVAGDSDRGWQHLRTKPYLPPDFDQTVFENLWRRWLDPLRSHAKDASPAERRRMTFSYYGLMEPPDDPGEGAPLGYVDTGDGNRVMNCLACHAGKVAGKVIPGLPNSHFALQTLTEDVRLTKLTLFKKLGHLDLASLKLPLGTTHGTTNSVIFGVVLGNLRDKDMNIDRTRPEPPQMHHDMDAPPLWNVRKKRSLYADGFAPKNHRVLMQFMLLPKNDRKTLSSWEDDFKDIQTWIESLQPPKYPFSIDAELAEKGRAVFNLNCSRCHGTYGADGKYEQVLVSLEEVGTDPIRLTALNRQHREWMRDGWMSRYGKDEVDVAPNGYVAQPLDGIWASAPYFHNGSVPTLWHVLNSPERPAVWKRTENGYDQNRVGLEVSEFETLPEDAKSAYERRSHFDTTKPGKSAAGHTFPDSLSESQKRTLVEYLKTL